MTRKKLEGAKRFGPRLLENEGLPLADYVLRPPDNSDGTQARLSFSDMATRKMLTPVALKAFVRLVAIWELTDSEAIALSGISMRRTWRRIKGGEWRGTLSQDQLTRLCAVFGIYKGLHTIYPESLVRSWLRNSNTGPLFRSRPPLDMLIAGGIPALVDARIYIDELCAKH